MSGADATILAALVDTVDSGVVVLDRNRCIAVWNAWMARASGIPGEEAVGREFSSVISSGSAARLRAAIEDALTSGISSILTHKLHAATFPLKTASGHPMTHNVAVRPVTGLQSWCLIQITDVTVSAERDRVLRERQNARYDAVVSSASDAIITLSTDETIQFANPAAEREFGYTASELVGIRGSALFRDQAEWSALFKTILSSGGEHPVELEGRRKDGSATYLEMSASTWLSQTRTFVTAILRDVNARRAAEDALRSLNLTLEQRVADRTAERDRMWRLSTDVMLATHSDGRIAAINPAWKVFFGWDDSQVIGLPLRNFIAESDRSTTDAALTELLETGKPRLFEVGLRTRSGGTRTIAWSAVAADGYIQAVGRDVTSEREAQETLRTTEEALRQAQKMEAIGQLTGGIAHDFNNLLTGIVGAMSMMKRRITAGRFDDLVRFMDAAISSANKAASLTHRLLAFARQQSLDPQPLDINELVEGMTDLLRRSLGEQVELKTNLGDDIWPALTDANQLENALLNLAINARDAMPKGGALAIETSRVTVTRPSYFGTDEITPGDYTLISVADTGVGIPSDVLAKVFDPFFTTKPIGQGTGLGLSMVYGFVKQSNGHVRIESQPGQGTKVNLYFPRYRGELSGQGEAADAEAPRGAGETVLLVEDDSSVRLLIAEVLRDLGYDCLEADDGPSALKYLNSDARLDLMISDVGLPGISGRQLADIGRERRPDLKILFVTGYTANATNRSGFLGAGMELITKPFNLDDLAIKIRTMIESDEEFVPRRTAP
jgi:PAS domain S-box-containing protein